MKIKFIQQCEDKRYGRVFAEGQTVDLSEGSAAHWIKRGLATKAFCKPTPDVVATPAEVPDVSNPLQEPESAEEKPQRAKRKAYGKHAVDPES